MEEYDIIIVGAGPAGLTAGIYAGRQNSKTLLIDKGLTGGLGLEVPAMENYPGYEHIAGMSLIAHTKKQCEKYCQINEMENIVNIVKESDKTFTVETDKDTYHTKSIILATGSKHRELNVPGEEEFKGRGVSYCATCDGMFFKGKDILMIGGGSSAAQEGIFLSNLGCNVHLVHRRDELRAEGYLQTALEKKGIDVYWNSTVKEIKGSQTVESVILKKTDGSIEEVKTDAVFVSIGDLPQNELAKDLGVDLDENGYIITDKNQKTNVDHVYSAGDITGGVKQWVVACGEGAVASTTAFNEMNL
ncbi:MAG: FAD-dependent oxidoreductase [Methanobacteriaceae archaeon]|mgnify:CR=1 FL=1|nr:FAD-dependent oxidoreductase [Methanobacteriaceae archaeon]